ncbi:MAG: PhoH family protein [Candidatus Eutrophobiaceae bacterium]
MNALSPPDSMRLVLEPPDSRRLANLCGPLNQHLQQVERDVGVQIKNRGNEFLIAGERGRIDVAGKLIRRLYASTQKQTLSGKLIHFSLREIESVCVLEDGVEEKDVKDVKDAKNAKNEPTIESSYGFHVYSRNQLRYLKAIDEHDLSFGIGPAGTGKTWLAVASAVAHLDAGRVQRVVLVRPAVEAGERLGFLPGDMAQKVDPYLRPLYDALQEVLGVERMSKLLARNVIEIAPLAFMRGRTINDAFMILDEAQNTTVEQMKMFLTRIGFQSKAVANGDVTQIDLPGRKESGLKQAIAKLQGELGIGFTFFDHSDTVRHPLVARVLAAWQKEA